MILACDPGLSGAFACLDGSQLHIGDMPTIRRPAGKRNTLRPFPDRPTIILRLQTWYALGCDVLIIELVGGIPGQAAHGAFTFGHGAGGITYAAEALGFRVVEVPAMRWKSAMKVPADKEKAIARATELFPAYVNRWAPVRGNGSEAQRSGRAEAAMLALYGQQTEEALV
jgi:crossover junction endodeoxyribonuclease RuvC